MTIFIYLLLCLLWGSTWLAIKIGLTDAPPLTTAALRFVVAIVVLFAIVAYKKLNYPRDLKKLLKLSYPGVYMYGVSYALIYFAEQYISSSLTAVLFGSFPFFVAGLSWLRYKSEKLTFVGWLGIVVGFLGVVLISYSSLETSGELFLGTLLAVGGSFAAAYGVVIHKQLYANENIYTSVTVQMAAGGILLVIAALIFDSSAEMNFTVEAIGSIIYLAIFGTVITFLGYYWLLTHTTVVTVSMIAFITPLVAIIIGMTLGQESLKVEDVIGTILILLGITAVIKKQKQAKSA